MADIYSTVTHLPLSCKSAAERMAREMEIDDTYADLTEDCCRKITELEQEIQKETGEKVALVAYRV
ncbi:MAG: hypothetical protein Q4E89_07090 [Eubacteriales bacterium]|nr:hypothetical protein [Eubacteriales bacterium]